MSIPVDIIQMGIRVIIIEALLICSNSKLSSMIVCIGEERHKERHWYKERLYQGRLYQERLYQGRLYQGRLYQERLYQERLYQERLYQERHRHQERHWHQEKIKL